MAEVGKYYVTVMPNMNQFNSQLSTQASSGGSKFGSLFSNSFAVALGNVASNLFNDIIGSFGDIVQAGMDASDAMARFEQTMGFAGVTGAEFDAARDAAKAYADATVYDLNTILSTTAQLASNGVADYESLMEAAGNLNAIAGGNADSFDSVALALTQVNGAGRLTTQDFNQLANAIPGASGQLQQALADMGAFDSETMNFRDAMAAGEISAEEFNAAIMNLGMSDAAQAAATSTDTFEGAIGNLQAAVENLSMGIMGALAPALTDIINGFTALVDEAAPQVEAFMSEVGPIIADLGSGLMEALVPALEQAGSFVMQLAAEYGPQLMELFNALMPAIQAVSDVLGSVLAPVLGVVGSIMGETTSNTITALTAAFNTITTTVNSVSNTLSTGFNAAKSAVTSVFDAIKSAMTDPIETAKGLISDAASAIESAINGIKFQLPDIKLPHISVSGGTPPYGIAGQGSLPHFSVEWYAEGGLVNGATLFGAGERGAELIWPSYSPYLERYAAAIAEHMGGGTGVYINAEVNDDAQVRAATRVYLRELQRLGAI